MESGGRRICSKGCERPVNVCLCDTLPSQPISTSTQIVILHHPHERHHKLATVPLLSKCLSNCHTLVGRRLRYGHSPLLDSLYDAALSNPNQPLPAAFLFPGTDKLPSKEISQWKSSFNDDSAKHYVLIAFDGTWTHAKEMLQASLPFLSKFASQVCLTYDVSVDGGTIYNSDLILRKEPFSGCMSTMEAVARCLRILESNGAEIESSLVDVLRSMVRFQACFLKPMKPRTKLLKKVKEDGKNGRTESSGTGSQKGGSGGSLKYLSDFSQIKRTVKEEGRVHCKNDKDEDGNVVSGYLINTLNKGQYWIPKQF